jgi:hypothetical protein
MNKFTTSSLLIIATLSTGFSLSANASDVAQNVCEYVAAEDKKRLRSFLKTNKLKIRKIFKSIKCDGENMLVFANTRSSIATGKLIIGKLGKGSVKKHLGALSGDLLAQATDRVSS